MFCEKRSFFYLKLYPHLNPIQRTALMQKEFDTLKEENRESVGL